MEKVRIGMTDCVLKHLAHTLHIGHVPIIERLVEGFCSIKHTVHILHIGHVPIMDTFQLLPDVLGD